MLEQNNDNTIGGPEPVNPREVAGFFAKVGSVVAVIVGGSMAFAFLVMPSRARGATPSAKLKWQERQIEVEQAIAAQTRTEGNSTAEKTSNQATVSVPSDHH